MRDNPTQSRGNINATPTRTQTRERIESARARFGPSDRARVQTLLALLAYFGDESHEATYRALYESADGTSANDGDGETVPPLALRPNYLATLLRSPTPTRARKPLPSRSAHGEPEPDDTAGVDSEVEDWWRRTP